LENSEVSEGDLRFWHVGYLVAKWSDTFLTFLLYATVTCSSTSGVPRIVFVSSLVVLGLFLVGCDSGGSNSSDGPASGSEDPSAEAVGEKATVEVGGGSNSSSSSLKAKASGNGVVTVTYFYESNREPCPAAASASVDPPETVTLTPPEPDCKTGPKKGISVQYLSLGSSEDGLEVELRDGDEVISSATTSEDGTARIEVEESATEDESESGTFDWVGSWKNTNFSGEQAYELTETSVTIVSKGPDGACRTTSGPIVDRSANTITTVENQAEVQYDVSVSSGTLTLTRGGVEIKASEISQDPVSALDCSIRDGNENDGALPSKWTGGWKVISATNEFNAQEVYYSFTTRRLKRVDFFENQSCNTLTSLFADVDGNIVTLRDEESSAAEFTLSAGGDKLTIDVVEFEQVIGLEAVESVPDCSDGGSTEPASKTARSNAGVF
jgi:hypothetical protein